jgi:protein-S-isoprenylcysteine O-methyltransferase Ste14
MFPNVEKNAFHLRHNVSAKVKTFSRIHLKQKRVENNMTEKAQKAPLSVFQLFLTTLYLLFFPALLFFVAGDWYWIEGWVYSLIFVGLCFALIIYLYFNDPGLLKERYSPAYQKGQALWDKVFLSVFMLLYFVWFVIIPLDAKRYHWSPEFPLWVKIVGGLLTILSFVIIFEVFRENSFAAPVVKVQEERHQKVISTGLYGIIRHPMYMGAIFIFIGPSLLLGSVYALVIGLVAIVLIAVRSIGEEKVLAKKLDGYTDYMKKVRWRLIPYIF